MEAAEEATERPGPVGGTRVTTPHMTQPHPLRGGLNAPDQERHGNEPRARAHHLKRLAPPPQQTANALREGASRLNLLAAQALNESTGGHNCDHQHHADHQ